MKTARKNRIKLWKGAGISLGLLTAATALGLVFRRADVLETNIVLLYILAVFFASALTEGYLYGICMSVAALLAFNYFFTEPRYTLNVYNPGYLVTFCVMAAVALMTGTLTSRVKRGAMEATEREKEATALYQLTGRLAQAENMRQIEEQVEASLQRFLGYSGSCRAFADLNTESGETSCCCPISQGGQVIGTITVPGKSREELDRRQQRFLQAVAECAALAMSRVLSVEQQQKSREEAERERYRGDLLRAISHDLRTPLTGIMGTSEMIMDMTEKADPRYELARGINKDAHWLHGLVENILSLTRLQEGRQLLNRQPEAVEEIIGGAAGQMRSRAPGYQFDVRVPEEVLVIPMDGKLIMQVLVNLMDNAVKHSKPEEPVSVSVEKSGDKRFAVFRVRDRGEGIAEQDLDQIFQAFYTSKVNMADVRRGIGLGLSICESVVRAHGGRIWAANRQDGPGAEFTFTLPLQ